MQLYKGETPEGESVALNNANSWTHTFTGLAEIEDSVPIAYTVREAAVPAGYTSEVTTDPDDRNQITITNTREGGGPGPNPTPEPTPMPPYPMETPDVVPAPTPAPPDPTSPVIPSTPLPEEPTITPEPWTDTPESPEPAQPGEDIPKTGDSGNGIAMAILFLAAAGVCITAVLRMIWQSKRG